MRVARVFSVRFAVCSDARNRRGRTGFMRVFSACLACVSRYVVTRGLAVPTRATPARDARGATAGAARRRRHATARDAGARA